MNSTMKSKESGNNNGPASLPQYPANLVHVLGLFLRESREPLLTLSACAEGVARALAAGGHPPLADERLVDDVLGTFEIAGYVAIEWGLGRVTVRHSELAADFV